MHGQKADIAMSAFWRQNMDSKLNHTNLSIQTALNSSVGMKGNAEVTEQSVEANHQKITFLYGHMMQISEAVHAAAETMITLKQSSYRAEEMVVTMR